jgi:hypothetical protein
VAYIPITNEIRTAAARLLNVPVKALDGYQRELLRKIVGGKIKNIDIDKWRRLFEAVDQQKLDKLAALADPARNPNGHERANAERALAKLRAKSAPGLEEIDRAAAAQKRWWREVLAEKQREWAEEERRAAAAKARSETVTPCPSGKTTAKASRSETVTPPPKGATTTETPRYGSGAGRARAFNAYRAKVRRRSREGLRCAFCEKAFTATRSHARYCSDACRQAAHRARH